MMTRARRRRLCLVAESSERERLGDDLGASDESPVMKTTEVCCQVHHDPQEWRDWANLLPPDLVEEISGRLLSLDVAEYLRFRTVCRPWRGVTTDPRTAGLLDNRFRPRNWMVLSINYDVEPRRRLLNLATAASLGVHLPALSTHCYICNVDGLLVLFHKPTKAIRLLDPLTNALTEFPAISSIAVAVPPIVNTSRRCCSIPSVLFRRGPLATIIFAKPGDAHWTLVSPCRASHPVYDSDRKVLFYTLLSLGGRCYISSREGSVYLLELQAAARVGGGVDQRCFAKKGILRNHIISLLVRDTGGRMLMVRYWRGMERFGGVEAYNPKELFRVGGITGRIEVLVVDIAGRRLVPVWSLGRYAVFVGLTHCLHISTETFPSISADSIYLGCFHQQAHGFGIYHINNINKKKNYRRIAAKHKLVYNITQGFAPAAQPYNLDEYLVHYVDHRHNFSKPCKNI
uniref:KIB1-4 beta-propeller domain-containing protein n=1 Tax=Aegilops tauschii TaxID=37682 RepID=M8ASS6_AEGTA